jgi:hypothetical protein
MNQVMSFSEMPVPSWAKVAWAAPGVVLAGALGLKAVVDAQPVYLAMAAVCLIVGYAMFQRKSGVRGPINVGPDGLRFTALSGESVGLGWNEIRYFDFVDRENPAKGAAFVSFEQGGQERRSVAIPLKRLAASDQAALLRAIEVYWPDLLSHWQAQLEQRKTAQPAEATSQAPVQPAPPQLATEARDELRRALAGGDVVEFKRSGLQFGRIAFNFLILAGFAIYSLVQWSKAGFQYDLIAGVIFGLWALFILTVASRRGTLARIDAEGISINGILRWRQIPYPAMTWYDFDAGKRAGVIAYHADGNPKERYAAFSRRLLSADFIGQMREAIGERRPDLPARSPDRKG